MIAGTVYRAGGQLYGLTHTDRTVVVAGRRKNGTIGSTGTPGLRKDNVAGLVREIGDDEDVILTRNPVRDGAGLCP